MEVLACPHCDRSFQVTPAALGKKIRCRGCRGIFHVPNDTTGVPLGRLLSAAALDEPLPPPAIPGMVDGHDARGCPECGRTFRMKDSFAGKTIRCRGCKMTFRVEATESATSSRTLPEQQLAPAGEAGKPAPARPLQPPPRPAPPVRQPGPPPTVFEDMGDVLPELLPGEQVASVVRPRKPPAAAIPSSLVATMIAVVLGGICSLPAVLVILRLVSKQKFEAVAAMLPEFLVGWLP